MATKSAYVSIWLLISFPASALANAFVSVHVSRDKHKCRIDVRPELQRKTQGLETSEIYNCSEIKSVRDLLRY